MYEDAKKNRIFIAVAVAIAFVVVVVVVVATDAKDSLSIRKGKECV